MSIADSEAGRGARGWSAAFLLLASVAALALRAPGAFGLHHWDEGLAWNGARWFTSLGAQGHYSPTHAPPFASLVFGLGARVLEWLTPLEGVAAAAWIAALLGTALVPVAYALGCTASGRRAGVCAAALCVLSPLHVDLARSLLTDTLYALLLLTALWLGLRAMRRPSVARWLLTGLAVGLLQATKYNGFLLLAPLGIAALVTRPRPWDARATGLEALAFVLPTLAVLAANLAALAWVGDLEGFFAHYSGYIGDRPPTRELIATLAELGFGGWTLAAGVAVGSLVAGWRVRPAGPVLVATLVLYLVFAARYTLYLRLLLPVVSAGLVLLGLALALPRRVGWSVAGMALVVALQAGAWWDPPWPRTERRDGHRRAVARINELPPELPRLVAGQEYVWEGLNGRSVHSPPRGPRARALLEEEPEVVLVYDVGAFSRLRDWDLEGLHGRLLERGGLEREPATLGIDCLQNNLGLDGVRRLAEDSGLAGRALGVHWVRIGSAELLRLAEP